MRIRVHVDLDVDEEEWAKQYLDGEDHGPQRVRHSVQAEVRKYVEEDLGMRGLLLP